MLGQLESAVPFSSPLSRPILASRAREWYVPLPAQPDLPLQGKLVLPAVVQPSHSMQIEARCPRLSWSAMVQETPVRPVVPPPHIPRRCFSRFGLSLAARHNPECLRARQLGECEMRNRTAGRRETHLDAPCKVVGQPENTKVIRHRRFTCMPARRKWASSHVRALQLVEMSSVHEPGRERQSEFSNATSHRKAECTDPIGR